MLIRTKTLLLTALVSGTLLAQSEGGPRTYRFTVDYHTADSRGTVVNRKRIIGEYVRGLAGGQALWRNVTLANADGDTGPFQPPEKRAFMEGFRYLPEAANTLKPGFFKGFPPTAVFERNLVWDTSMIEQFGQAYLEQLKLNEPYHVLSNQDLNMPEVGAFHSRDVVLERIGTSRRNGRECALIQYQAFFNPIEIANGGMMLKGRSDYWGQIWVSTAAREIEYATLFENVTGEMQPPGQTATQVVHVFRTGILEPLTAR